MNRTTIVITVFLTGCASASGVAIGPNGKPIWFIEGNSAELAFSKAGEKCPTGYNIIGNPTINSSNNNYLITAECK